MMREVAVDSRSEQIADRDSPSEICSQIALLEAALRVHAERSSWAELLFVRETWEEET